MKFRQELFWDVNPDNIDPEKHARYIIERVLEFGNDGEVRWMKSFYTPSLIREVVEKSRSLMPETRNLWHLILKKS